MRRTAPCTILLLVPALAWGSAGYADPDRGSCVDAAPSAAHGSAPDANTATPARTGNRPQATPASTQGGGGDGDMNLPRMRMPRWHSFLPGMFR